LAKKREKEELYEKEMEALAAKTATANKVTKAQIEAQKRKEQQLRKEEDERKRLEAQKIVVADELTENVNQIVIEGDTARNVEEAIAVLTNDSPAVEKHPEKRVKAAYAEFESRRLPQLKEEKPTLRLSQLKQVLKKEWQKSPENPLNEKIMGILK
jgi:hypothetical protein